MELEVIYVFAIIIITIVLFITEYFPIDKIAFFIIVALLLLNLTTPQEAISGFSNPATITILALMILAVGLEENGVIQWLTDGIKKLKILPLVLLTPAFMVVSAGISAFISTTAVVIIFIKIISQLSEKYNFSSSKLLMPISFAGILGGSCTLMGTSTNLLVNAIAQDLGAEKLGFFEFALFGCIFVAIGVVFMTLASRFLPKDAKTNMLDSYHLDNYMFTVNVGGESDLIDKKIGDIDMFTNGSVSIVKLVRNKQVINAPGKYIELKENDSLILMSDLDNVNTLLTDKGLHFHEKKTQLENTSEEQEKIPLENLSYVELLILPGSNLIGKNLKQLRYMILEGAYPIAIKKRKNIRNTKERLVRKNLNQINLKPGDRVLVEMQEQSINKLYNLQNVAILNQHDFVSSKSFGKKLTALLILLGVIGLAASGVLTILTASLTGVAAMLLTKLISLENVYQKVNWQIIFLLAGMIPLGAAMANTGADTWLSEQLLQLLNGQKPMIVIAILFGCTMLISGTISNNATAIIMTPIAIAIASGLDLSLKPFILAVMFGANFSFFTPVGYQTNTLIYGTGAYRFKHFLLIGGGLSAILWVLGTLLLTTLL